MGVVPAPSPDAHAHALVELEQSASPPPMSSCGRYILHRVCRFDTLAGVAIKYGVEVADVKRVNGLTADLQMFAHKTLRIPLLGRRPPAATNSPRLPINGNAAAPPSSSPSATDRAREWSTRRPPKNGTLDPFLKPPRSTVTPSMSRLQGYYGLPPPPRGDSTSEGTEMATYSKGQHRKARSLSTGFCLVNGDANGVADDAEKPIRRRQKAEPELSSREDNSGGLLARIGQGLALRPKSGNRPDTNNSQQHLLLTVLPSYGDGLKAVRKSSSTPEFQDPDSSSSSIASVWLKSTWNLKPDAFTLPLAIPLFDSIPRPLFDSISKPIAAWRNKAARD